MESRRFELRENLTETLGKGPASTLMESLPPVEWRELAAKTDLAALEGRVNTKIDTGLARLEAKIDTGLARLDAKIDAGLAEVKGMVSKLEGKTERLVARQTYVMLVGVAALVTPVYLALFAGLGT